jgi:predicted Zn-dependent protease with MMP-like domain
MKRARFETLVWEAVENIPPRFRKAIDNLAIVVEDEPSPELLEELEIEPPDVLYGLYTGTPLPERGWAYGNALPDQIVIYQKPIEADCETEEEVVTAVGETVIHEVGHYFGLDDDELEAIEDQYWRSRARDEENEE